MASAVCPVVGTTNHTLPPSHPDIDLDKEGQVCPVVGATTTHHGSDILSKHPSVPIPNDSKGPTSPIATSCPALKTLVKEPKSKAMDDEICPVVGTASNVLPVSHPSISEAKEGDVCPVTKASAGHHKSTMHSHPDVEATGMEEKVCPVTGQKGAAH